MQVYTCKYIYVYNSTYTTLTIYCGQTNRTSKLNFVGDRVKSISTLAGILVKIRSNLDRFRFFRKYFHSTYPTLNIYCGRTDRDKKLKFSGHREYSIPNTR